MWVWAIVGGVVIYVYRSRRALSGGGASSLSATSPDASATNAASRDPIPLAPGESVYDPNSGHIVGAAPEQTPTDPGLPPVPVGDPSFPLEPVTLEPGEQVYDPNSGKLFGSPEKAAGKHNPKKAKRGKNTAKKKPQHHKHKAVKPAKKHIHKPRSVAKVIDNKRHKPTGGGAPKGRARGKNEGGAKAPSPRVRAKAAAVTAPAVRQRPAAPTAVNHAAQRVAPHPAPHPAARPAPAPRPPSRPKPAPPRKRGR